MRVYLDYRNEDWAIIDIISSAVEPLTASCYIF